MPRRKEDGPIVSKLNSKDRGDGVLRYETTIPIPVGESKGDWIARISKDNVITWITPKQYLEKKKK